MKIVFFGTPYYVVPILKKLKKYHEIVAVVTQSPKLVGRKQIKTFSEVDNFAHQKHVPIQYDFEGLPKADMGVCASFGKIIPKNVIDSFPLGILNIHPSLLPKYRGASPVTEAIKNGDTQTGVTIMKMDDQMDHGPIVTQFKEEINPKDTTPTLRDRLFERSADVLTELIEPYSKGKINLKKQNEENATITKILTKEDGFIDLSKNPTPTQIDNFIRAMDPWPGAWTYLPNQKRIKLLPNNMVQLEGKNPVSLEQFNNAYPDLLPLK